MSDENIKNTNNIKRWRLILGAESEDNLKTLLNNEINLSKEQILMDKALSSIYNNTSGTDLSTPQISKWLGDIRTLFDNEIVKVIQSDAIERKGLKQLIFEPEMLNSLEPDINLAATIMELKDQIPKRSKESVRAFIQKIVEEIEKMLAEDIRRAITAAINKRQHSPIPSAAAMDFKTTIKRNLKNYNTQLNTIVPEHFYFYDHCKRSNNWTVIIDIDQSGSMGQSVIYSSIIACILASMNSIKTRIVAFDTNIIDLTEKTDDPVDLLFGIQLGGGTDINKSVAYCQQFIENPSKTLFFLISDLDEGGNLSGFLRRVEEMKQSGVTVISLLAIADGGKPYYNSYIAQKISAMNVPCFACTPNLLPQILECALKGQDLKKFEV